MEVIEDRAECVNGNNCVLERECFEGFQEVRGWNEELI